MFILTKFVTLLSFLCRCGSLCGAVQTLLLVRQMMMKKKMEEGEEEVSELEVEGDLSCLRYICMAAQWFWRLTGGFCIEPPVSHLMRSLSTRY